MNKFLPLFIVAFCFQGIGQENRTFDGTGNNVEHPNWGAAFEHFRNFVSNGFADLLSEPGGQDRENPRIISNLIGSQTEFMANELELSDFVWGWGQFIDHDINFNNDNGDEQVLCNHR